jgi:hypothetical protein
MRVPERTIGAITFVTASSKRNFDPEDQALGEQLGRRAAVAVENARLHSRLEAVAETLERSLLPGELPAVPGWQIASLYRPVRSELRIDIGGDFFEVFRANDRWYAILGDVEGKGVTAATLTALMRNGAHFAAGTEAEPAAILARLDEGLRRHGQEATCTAVCAARAGASGPGVGRPPARPARLNKQGGPRSADSGSAARRVRGRKIQAGRRPDRRGRLGARLYRRRAAGARLRCRWS